MRFEKKTQVRKNSGFPEKTQIFVNFQKTQVKSTDFRLVLLNTPTKKNSGPTAKNSGFDYEVIL